VAELRLVRYSCALTDVFCTERSESSARRLVSSSCVCLAGAVVASVSLSVGARVVFVDAAPDHPGLLLSFFTPAAGFAAASHACSVGDICRFLSLRVPL
jgi:hypothetical protein